jgi:hypothetical protein
MANAFKRRLTAQDIPGYAGGTLEDELIRQQQNQQPPASAFQQRFLEGQQQQGQQKPLPQPSMMGDAPPPEVPQQPQERPRMVNPPPPEEVVQQSNLSQTGAPPAMNTFKQRLLQAQAPTSFGSSGEPFMAARDRRTQPRDYVSDDSQFLRDVQSKPLSLKDKLGMASQSVALSLGGKPLQTGRQREEAGAMGQLGQDLAIQKEQSQRDLSEMVPIQLPDGTWTKTPAKNVATIASRNQEQGFNREQRMAAAQAHKDRWAQMGKHERVQDALRVYNSGGANDPETLAAISSALDLPKDLQPKFVSGEVALQADDAGQIQAYNKRTGQKTDTGITSWNVTAETGRNTRRDKNAADAMERTRLIAQSGAAKLGDVPELDKTRGMLETYAAEKDQEAQELADDKTPGGKQRMAKLQGEATQYRLHAAGLSEAIAKAKGAQSNVQPNATHAQAPPGFLKAFKNKHGRAPTQTEIDAYAKAAQR